MPQPYAFSRSPWDSVNAGYQAANALRRDQAVQQAGNALRSNDYGAASGALFGAGMVKEGVGVQDLATARASAAKATADKQRDDALKFTADAAARLRRIYDMTPEPLRKERVLGAFDQITPLFKRFGESDDELAQTRQLLEHDPETTLSALGAGGEKLEWRTIGDEVVGLRGDGSIAARYRGAKAVNVGDNGLLVEVPGSYGPGEAAAPPKAEAVPPTATTAPKPPTGEIYGQIANLAGRAGASPDEVSYLQRLAQVESAGNPAAQNGSSTGLYQFKPATFTGLGGQNINDVGDQTRAALKLSRQDRAALKASNLPVTPANTYLLHQQGTEGGRALLTAPPEMNAVAALAPAYNGDEAQARQAFLRNGGTADMTAGQFVQMWARKWGGGQPASAPAAADGNALPGGVRVLVDRRRGPEWVDLPGGGQQNTRTGKKEGVPTGEDIELSGDALDYVAQQYVATGQLPPLGTGKVGAANRAKVINRAAAIEKETGATGQDAVQRHLTVKAAGMALNQVSKQRAMISSFEQTALKNADLALQIAPKGAAQGNVPVLNKWIQVGRKSVQGDPDVAAFDLALGTFADEYAKVVSGSMGNTALSDSARHEAYRRINSAMTIPQLKAVIATMKVEMHNRMLSLDDEMEAQRSVIKSGGAAKPAAAPEAAPPPPSAATIPAGAIAALKRDPRLSAQFDAKYGQGQAAKIIGGR